MRKTIAATLRRPSRGFTLVEVMVVLIVVGVLTAFCLPSFQKALEQSRVDIASANLRAIWSAERLYWLEYHFYTDNLNGLKNLGMIDPEILQVGTDFDYSASTTDGFQAVAERSGSTFWTGRITIDETGAIGGAVTAGDGTVISPGFQ